MHLASMPAATTAVPQPIRPFKRANRTNPIFTQPTEADKPLRSETEFRPLQRTLGSVTNRGSATNRGGATNRGRATARQ